MNNAQNKQKTLVTAGMLAAVIALLTFTFHIPTHNGYIHCGDAAIYLAAAILPTPYAMAAAAIGGAMADLLAGYTGYVLPTFLIKAMLALCFAKVGGAKGMPMVSIRKVMATIGCAVITIIGYWLTAVILYGGFGTQFLLTAPGNVIQATASALLYFAIAATMERVQKLTPRT